MNVLEAGRVIAAADGKFELLTPEHGDANLRIKYTGNDPEEESQILQALLVIADTLGAEMVSLATDDVHTEGHEA